METSEKAFLANVMQLATLRGWLCYHTHNSKHSPSGFPDLVLCRPHTHPYHNNALRCIFAELKTETGTLSAEQSQWLVALMGANQAFFVWTPADWQDIERILGGE